MDEEARQNELAETVEPAKVPGYPENYTGPVSELSPELLNGLGGLMHELNPDYSGDPIPAEALQAQLEQPTFKQIIAVREGYLAGTVSASVGWELYAGRFVQLGSVVVHPAFRGEKDESGKAVIDHLLEEVDAFAQDQQASQILFEVDPENARAQGAYERWGAQRINTVFYVRSVPEVQTNESAQTAPPQDDTQDTAPIA